jgi:hypothetical protein
MCVKFSAIRNIKLANILQYYPFSCDESFSVNQKTILLSLGLKFKYHVRDRKQINSSTISMVLTMVYDTHNH